MSKSYSDLFTFIMEADDDTIPDFDTGDLSAETPGEDASAAPPANDQPASDDAVPPPAADDGSSFGDFNADVEDEGTADENGESTTADEDNNDGKKIGQKTNDILNERLYRKLNERNKTVEDLIEQIQNVFVVLPYETVNELDKPLNQLKTALSKGQSYAIDSFIKADYGENLLFYEKLNSAYVLIENSIDKILKKAKNGKDQ